MIVTTETGGLGNRLKSWASAMRLDPGARVYWPVTDNMPARFDELFANGCAVESVPPGAIEHKSWRLVVLPEDEPYLPAGFATAGAGAHPIVRGFGKAWWTLTGRRDDRYRYMLFPKQHSRRSTRRDARHIDLEYSRIPAHFRRVYGRVFARIEIEPEIRRAVDAWALEHLDDWTIGVQVRTWRDDTRRHRKYHRTSVHRLLELTRSAPPSSRFFVVSDSDEIGPWLRRELGAERVLQFPRETLRGESWRAPAGMREDLIDMLLIARTPRMFVSYLSTFGETAWWLGGATADVTVF